MTSAERKGVLAAAVLAAIGIGSIVVATDRAGHLDGWSSVLSVVLGYLIGAACLAFVGWFAVALVRQVRSSRRFSDPFGDGDATAVAEAAAGAELAGVRSVLFVSPRGIGRSRMAAAYLQALTLGTHRIVAAAAAPDPASTPPPARNEAFLVMGLDQAAFDPTRPVHRASPGLVERADLVVRIGCARSFRVPTYTRVRDWDVPDPVGAGVAVAWETRDEVKRRVEELAVALGLANRSLALRDRVIPGQRQVFATGRATEPYPDDDDDETTWMFRHAEARVLAEVAEAPTLADEVNGRGPRRPDFVVPWMISTGAAASAFAEELAWRSVGTSPRLALAEGAVDRVVAWLAAAGALRPLSEAHRLELQRSGRAQRTHEHPPEDWPTGLAGEYPAMASLRAAEEDRSTWEVVPDRMLAVYPDLDLEGRAWAGATRSHP
ncbi:hypothetical protein DEI99_007860 [Curtobacterium sp. MCLR17_036]|uniref:hypothetical protein n=1 Tax=Curtobacterium sp. MCLR17_036 TaxID=2175620 RepID=UPI000DA958E2|nr:hypothetical protein [Curtobacterium sp. MCLR17_036]WIE66441.1 hypothetical protein DEI99_007860 [Curtobacterium sp. MCLR17_036]